MSHKSSDGHVESSSSPQQVTQKLISSEVRSAVSGSAMHPSLFLTQPHQIVLQQARVDLSERWRSVLLRGVQGTGGVLFGVGRTLLRYLQLRDETVPLEYTLDLSGAGTTNREPFQSASLIGWDAFVQMWTNHSSPCHTPWTAVISTLADKHLFNSMLEQSGDALSRGPCYRLLNLRVLVLFPKPMLTRWAGPAREITGSTFDQQFRLVPPQPHSNTFRIFETLLHADGKARASLLHDAPLHEGPGASFWTTNKAVPRKKVVLVTHVLNEEHFLPYWIVQHSPHFDRVVLIDYNSSDRTRELVYRFAPSSWSVARYARPAQFINVENDNDVLTEENRFPEWWKVSLTAMEHLVGLHFRAHLRSTQHPCHEVTLCAVAGDDPFEFPLSSVGLRRWVPLALQRRRVSVSLPRILHSYGKDFMGRYHRGRHLQLQNKICAKPRLPTLPFAVVMKFAYSPWPELQVRKDLIRSMVVNATNGAKHHQRSWNAWNRARREKRGKFRFSPLNLTSRDHLHNFRKAWQNEFLLTFEDRVTNDNQSKHFTRIIV